MRVPVSLKYSDAGSFSRAWHVGETQDVSVDGMRIVLSSLEELPGFSRLEILFFPNKTVLWSYIPEPEPVSMSGVVIWQDIVKKVIGIKFDSDGLF